MISDPRFIGREVGSLEQKLLDFSPLRQYQDFTITLPANANTPFDVAHKLNTSDPNKVRWEVIQMPYPLVVFRSSADISGPQFLRLRCTTGSGSTGNVVIRLRLSLDDGAAVENPPTPNPQFNVPSFNDQVISIGNRAAAGTPVSGIFFGPDSASSFSGSHSFGFSEIVGGASIGSELNFVDLQNTQDPRLMRWRYLSTGPLYEFGPHHTGAGLFRSLAGGKVNLGSVFESGSRWDSVYAQNGDFATAIYERGRSTAVGAWTPIAYAAGNFTTNAGTWTVALADQITARYTVIGMTMLTKFTLQATSVSGAPTDLKVTIPGGFTAAADGRGTFHYNNNGTKGTGYYYVTAGGTTINFRLETDGTWANAVDTTNIEASPWFEVQ